MRHLSRYSVSAYLFSWALLAFGQSQDSGSPPVVRDAVALAAVRSSILAMAGAINAQQFQTVRVSGHMVIPKDGSSREFTYSYKIAGPKFLFRKEVQADSGTTIFASGHDKPFQRTGTEKVSSFPRHILTAAVPFDVPMLLLAQEVQNLSNSVKLIEAAAGSPLHVQTEDETDAETRAVTTQDWYFDPVTHLPVRVEYRLPNVINALKSISARCEYLSFSNVEGVTVPALMKAFEKDQEAAQIVVEKEHFNESLSDDFDKDGTHQ